MWPRATFTLLNDRQVILDKLVHCTVSPALIVSGSVGFHLRQPALFWVWFWWTQEKSFVAWGHINKHQCNFKLTVPSELLRCLGLWISTIDTTTSQEREDVCYWWSGSIFIASGDTLLKCNLNNDSFYESERCSSAVLSGICLTTLIWEMNSTIDFVSPHLSI